MTMAKTPAIWARRFVEKAAVLGLAWWVIAEANPAAWVFGVPFVLVATALSLRLAPSRTWRISVIGAARFGAFFALQSVLGGLDVANRVIRPRIPLDPEIVTYRMRLTLRSAQVLFADTISLLPGTLSAGLDNEYVTVHVIDRSARVLESLGDVEERVGDLFGITFDTDPHPLGVCELTRGVCR